MLDKNSLNQEIHTYLFKQLNFNNTCLLYCFYNLSVKSVNHELKVYIFPKLKKYIYYTYGILKNSHSFLIKISKKHLLMYLAFTKYTLPGIFTIQYYNLILNKNRIKKIIHYFPSFNFICNSILYILARFFITLKLFPIRILYILNKINV